MQYVPRSVIDAWLAGARKQHELIDLCVPCNNEPLPA